MTHVPDLMKILNTNILTVNNAYNYTITFKEVLQEI